MRVARAVALVAGVRVGSAAASTERVASIARSIAEALRLDPATADRCEATGWLRDIGLVALPDDVLSPAHPDAAADSPVRRMHVVLGEQAVRRVPEIAALGPAIRHHHERFDGSGYPDALAGGDVPVEARVVACAEAVATLVPEVAEGRVRRQGVVRLRERAGAALDPGTVEAAVVALAAEAGRAGQYLPRAA